MLRGRRVKETVAFFWRGSHSIPQSSEGKKKKIPSCIFQQDMVYYAPSRREKVSSRAKSEINTEEKDKTNEHDS